MRGKGNAREEIVYGSVRGPGKGLGVSLPRAAVVSVLLTESWKGRPIDRISAAPIVGCLVSDARRKSRFAHLSNGHTVRQRVVNIHNSSFDSTHHDESSAIEKCNGSGRRATRQPRHGE